MVSVATGTIVRLQLVSGEALGRAFELMQDRVSIGRDDSNVICIDDITVSLHHAILVRAGEHYKVRDLISTNGTYINGERTMEGELHNGDVVHFGEVEMRYEELERPTEVPKTRPQHGALPLERGRPLSAAASEKQYKIIASDGRTYGPADAALVRKWISQGFANAQTWVPAEARGNWQQLGEFPEFADALVEVTTPTNLLGTPPKEALWEEPIKVGPSADTVFAPAFEGAPVVAADQARTGRRVLHVYLGVLLLLAIAASTAAWRFGQWPFNSQGPLKKYARTTEREARP